MKICLVSPSLQMGGVERSSSTLANYFQLSGHEVHFISIFPHPIFFELNSSIRMYQPAFNKSSLLLLRTILWLRGIIKGIDPEVVLAFNNIYSAMVLTATMGTHYKICTTDRSSPHFKWPWRIALFTNFIFFLKPPHAVISQTSIAAKYTSRRLRGKFKKRTIPNALRAIELYDLPRQKFVLGVGRLGDPLKGFDRLIEAFSQIGNTEWKLVFAGGGEDGAYLRAQAAGLSILDRVKFLGKVKGMDKLYAEAGIFVIPSRNEGFPNALCEAMAAGVPCISFNFVAGPSDIIQDGVDGILVEDGDIKALAIQMKRLMDSEELRIRLGSNAKKIVSRFNEKKIGDEVLGFLSCI